jgi:hypothetical protein
MRRDGGNGRGSTGAQSGGPLCLAETEGGRIEVCACGAWPFSLRRIAFHLSPSEASELFVLLGQAVTAGLGRPGSERTPIPSLSFRTRRGDA